MAEALPRAYRMARNAVLGFLLAHLLSGLAVFLFAESQIDQVYPVYAWSLFRNVPPRTFDAVDVRILAVGDRNFTEPLSLEDAPEYVAAVPFGDYNAPHMKFSRGFASGDESLIREARQAIESRFLAPRIRYEVVRVTYDIIEHWKTGAYTNAEQLAVFESGQ